MHVYQCVRVRYQNWAKQSFLGSNHSFYMVTNDCLARRSQRKSAAPSFIFCYNLFHNPSICHSPILCTSTMLGFDVNALTLIMQFWWKQRHHKQTQKTWNEKVCAEYKPSVILYNLNQKLSYRAFAPRVTATFEMLKLQFCYGILGLTFLFWARCICIPVWHMNGRLCSISALRHDT